jgi:transposase
MIIDESYIIENYLANATTKGKLVRAEALLLRAQGWSFVDIADDLGCHPDTASRWWSHLAKQYQQTLVSRQEPQIGRPAILSTDKSPIFISLVHWSQSLQRPYRGEELRDLLASREITMSVSTVYRELHKHRFSFQKPRPMNPHRDETQVQQWKAEFPATLKKLQEDQGDKIVKVFFQDETRYGQKGIMTPQWAPVGKRPTRERQDEFGNAYIFGAACPETGQSHFLVASEIGSEFMQLFLNSFAKTLGRKVHALLVLDNASWHTSQRLVVPSNITLHPLPPYAPDLNPIENLWLFMKKNYLCNRVYRDSKQIIDIGASVCKKVTKEIIKSVCARNYCST